MVKHLFDLQASRCTNLLEHLALLANQNALLTFALTVDGSGNPGQFGLLFKLIDADCGSVRNLFVGAEQNLFADNFGAHKTDRLVGHLIFWKIMWACGKKLYDLFQQQIDTIPGPSRKRNNFLEVGDSAEALNQGQKFLFFSAQQIHFIREKKDWSASAVHQLKNKFVLRIGPSCDVNNQENKIASLERFVDFGHHLLAEGTIGFVDTRSIDENYLAMMPAFLFRHVYDSKNAVAGGLRLGAHDGQLLFYQRVQESGFARVWAADDAHETGVESHEEIERYPLLYQFGLNEGDSYALYAPFGGFHNFEPQTVFLNDFSLAGNPSGKFTDKSGYGGGLFSRRTHAK